MSNPAPRGGKPQHHRRKQHASHALPANADVGAPVRQSRRPPPRRDTPDAAAAAAPAAAPVAAPARVPAKSQPAASSSAAASPAAKPKKERGRRAARADRQQRRGADSADSDASGSSDGAAAAAAAPADTAAELAFALEDQRITYALLEATCRRGMQADLRRLYDALSLQLSAILNVSSEHDQQRALYWLWRACLLSELVEDRCIVLRGQYSRLKITTVGMLCDRVDELRRVVDDTFVRSYMHPKGRAATDGDDDEPADDDVDDLMPSFLMRGADTAEPTQYDGAFIASSSRADRALPNLRSPTRPLKLPPPLPSDTASDAAAALPLPPPAARRGPADAAPARSIESAAFGPRWLREQCDAFVRHATTSLTSDEVLERVSTVLMSTHSDEAIQGELFDLLGMDAFEFLGELLQHRGDIVRQLTAFVETKRAVAASGAMRSTSTSVRSEAQMEREKRRARLMRDYGYVPPSLVDQLDSSEAESLQLQAALIDDLISLVPSADAALPGLPVSAMPREYHKRSQLLPPDVRRTTARDYTLVEVPAQPKFEVDQSTLVPITALDEYAQPAFAGVARLNRMQSVVFESAFRSNENLLICAPTGAGKTNVALLTILHEVGRHIRGTFRREDVKIVYIAPMKALAQEMVEKFSKQLAYLGMVVRECTGDMQLTKKELANSQIIVTTPEKWDVITRKSNDASLAQSVQLLIIDEVHLLADDRGAVLESLVARTLRQVESSQSLVRIVGLSATLPNYRDVAEFLRVQPETGLFHFDASFRPVPLSQKFYAVSIPSLWQRQNTMLDLTFDEAVVTLKQASQVMVFVHSRKEAMTTAEQLLDKFQQAGRMDLLETYDVKVEDQARRIIDKIRSPELRTLTRLGVGCHHAGILRADRNAVERLFSIGAVKVLCCTATLAWGVNLPAHKVIIKGTRVYDAEKGTFVDVSLLDILQIFGRAGRPQFDTFGEGVIISEYDKINHYLRLLFNQRPIESHFEAMMRDNLNAEIVLGTVSNLVEAAQWLSYTYLFIRMRRNPFAYAVSGQELREDPLLHERRLTLVTAAARELDKARMIRFDELTGTLSATDLGRVASHYYVRADTIEMFNSMLDRNLSEPDTFKMICMSGEFQQMKCRQEELGELDSLAERACHVEVRGGPENTYGKACILLQAYISNAQIKSFALVSDTMYIMQSAGRIARALFEIVLRRRWSGLALRLLTIAKMIDHRMWRHESVLRQFGDPLPTHVLQHLETRNATLERLRDMDTAEIGALVQNRKYAAQLYDMAQAFPTLDVQVNVQPITRSVLRITLTLRATFQWYDRYHGAIESWWVWVEDPNTSLIMHHEEFGLKKVQRDEEHQLVFLVPISEPVPPQYYVRAVSERWLGAETVVPVSFQHLILPDRHPSHTDLLPLQPMPVAALRHETYEKLYKFSAFNPIQTQIFHTLYHTDRNVLLGAPTGSGKTIAAELAMLRLFNVHPSQKVVYIAPLKALVRERMRDWTSHFGPLLGKKIVELTGDFTPDQRALKTADVLVTTPEKWDGISRSWQIRGYVQSVGLVVIDEIHLLGEDRGPILEVIVSRMRYISSHTDRPVRVIGLSTALANAHDLADWLGIDEVGLYNFRPSVRPVPLETHLAGFPGKHYCPRMATMNRPAYLAIQQHSPTKPVLIFVSSRRQTRLTAMDLISFCATSEDPRQFLRCPEADIDALARRCRDASLKSTLAFGIGIHHAGLCDSDRSLVEELYVACKIQVLVCTATLAWGVNFPAHLVIIKGTEYFDAKLSKYVDYPITDVLQMMGRAGRPQFDQSGKAVIFVHEPKKTFYRNFLYQPFPVESSLMGCLHNHFNAEIVAGTIASKQDAMDYLSWTYLYRRVIMNPSYYGLEDAKPATVNTFLSGLVQRTLVDLERAGCIEVTGDEIASTVSGRIASYYYLDYKSVDLIGRRLRADLSFLECLQLLCDVTEFDELPVRHCEDEINADLASTVPFPPTGPMDSPHTKAMLLLQCHMFRLPLPISDYITDTKSVLDQSIRIVQAMCDIAAEHGFLSTALNVMHLSQCVCQGRWITQSSLRCLSGLTGSALGALQRAQITTLPQLMAQPAAGVRKLLAGVLNSAALDKVCEDLQLFPSIDVSLRVGDVAVDASSAPSVQRSQSIAVQVHLKRVSRATEFVFAPAFAKPKSESWWLVIGNAKHQDMLAVKRVSFRYETDATLTIDAPFATGRHDLVVYMIADSYIGLDQEVDLPLDVHA